jgi:hypothetical protein
VYEADESCMCKEGVDWSSVDKKKYSAPWDFQSFYRSSAIPPAWMSKFRLCEIDDIELIGDEIGKPRRRKIDWRRVIITNGRNGV